MQGCVCPHPPLLVPEIGRDNLERVRATQAGMEQLAAAVGEPDSAVIISPHTPTYPDVFTVRDAPLLHGDFAAFGCPQVRREIETDIEFMEAVLDAAPGEGLGVESVHDERLDWGVLVPLMFLRPRRLLSVSIVADYAVHRRLGRLIRRVAEDLGRAPLFIASGDLSHRLIPGAPAGYDERGAAFDRRVVELLSGGDFAALEELDDTLVGRAGECGLRSIIALGGFLGDEAARDPRIFSYEGPFGVGSLVAGFCLANAGRS